MKSKMTLREIGKISTGIDGKKRVCLHPDYLPGLKNLELFSHVFVIWWADKCENEDERKQLVFYPPYAEEHLTGVFACRSPIRPNPLAITVCEIKGVDSEKGFVEIDEIDASAGSPVLDLKAYFPVYDRVNEFRQPDWLPEYWGEWRYPVPEQD